MGRRPKDDTKAMAWYCRQCGVGHNKPKAMQCRTCKTQCPGEDLSQSTTAKKDDNNKGNNKGGNMKASSKDQPQVAQATDELTKMIAQIQPLQPTLATLTTPPKTMIPPPSTALQQKMAAYTPVVAQGTDEDAIDRTEETSLRPTSQLAQDQQEYAALQESYLDVVTAKGKDSWQAKCSEQRMDVLESKVGRLSEAKDHHQASLLHLQAVREGETR